MNTRQVHLGSCLLALLGCSLLPAHAADWSCYQHDPARTGRSAAVVDTAKLAYVWSAPMGYSTPLIVGDTIYSTRNQQGVGGAGHATLISAFELASGAIKWTYSGDFLFPSQAAVGGGFVVFHSGISGSDPGQLYVLDAITGVLRYKVPLTPAERTVMPLLVPNLKDGTVMAYCADPYTLRAVQLGQTGGFVLWAQHLGQGQSVNPTLVGSSIIIQGSAYDLSTGAQNLFHFIGGGGSKTVVYDSARRNIYVWKLDDAGRSLVAYRYTNNAQIDFLWHHFGPGIGFESVAIGPDGKVYSTGESVLVELDPDTGESLRSAPGEFATFQTPTITAGLVWTNSDYETMAYNLETLELARRFPGANFATDYSSSGAFSDGYFVLDNGGVILGRPGFDVYGNPAAQALNISTRMRVEVGENVMIGGFIIEGTETKRLLIRALGPTLQQFGISGVLPNPTLDLIGSAGLIIRNNDWRGTQEAQIQATGLPPPDDLEAAVVVNLVPGNYTAVVRDANGGSGVGLVEVYDLEPDAESRLANISTRGFVDGGENVMIGGFILGNGAAPARVVVRAIGPSLTQQGVSGALQDPVLELRDANGMLIRNNDNWRDSQQAEIETTGLAPGDNAESAIIATLPPSVYTAIVAGKNGLTGVGLVEIYQLR